MAKTYKEKQAMIRLAGLSAEKKFFDPRGIFAKAGHVEHLKRRASGNPNLIQIAKGKVVPGERPKKNPITVVGNPPTRINTAIAGVLYNRCCEIRAEKTSKTNLAGLYYHPFLERSKVMVLALDNGDILIHSQVGEKLWKLD